MHEERQQPNNVFRLVTFSELRLFFTRYILHASATHQTRVYVTLTQLSKQNPLCYYFLQILFLSTHEGRFWHRLGRQNATLHNSIRRWKSGALTSNAFVVGALLFSANYFEGREAASRRNLTIFFFSCYSGFYFIFFSIQSHIQVSDGVEAVVSYRRNSKFKPSLPPGIRRRVPSELFAHV